MRQQKAGMWLGNRACNKHDTYFQHGLIHTVLYLFLHCDNNADYVQIHILQKSYTGDNSVLVHTVSKLLLLLAL
jgi:hypothetical protein